MSAHRRQPSPELQANWISRIVFWWLNGIFLLGAKRDLEFEDVYDILPGDEASILGARLSQEWTEEIYRSNGRIKKNCQPPAQPKLMKAVIRTFGAEFFLLGFIDFMGECIIKMALPLCLAQLIRNFSADFDQTKGLLYGGAIILGSFLNVLTDHIYSHWTERLGMQIRVSCAALVYRKSFRLSHTSLGKTNAGQMINLFANDMTRMEKIRHIDSLWIGIVQLGFITYILWGYFSYYSLCGLPVLFLYAPLQVVLGKILSAQRQRTAIKTDARLRLINEIVNGINVIKMFAWELTFAALVKRARKSEMLVLRKTQILRALNLSFSFASTQIIVFLILFAYGLDGNQLTAEKVFVCVSLAQAIRDTVGICVPLGISELGDFLMAIKRVQEFLLLEELSNYLSVNCTNLDYSTSPEINVTDLSVELEFGMVLSNVDMKVSQHQLFAIVGPVGAGKSTLLLALLREHPPRLGDVKINGTIAYAPQESWIFGGNIRDNILFGKEFDPDWYECVVEACDLDQDLESLPNRDFTIVGDRGVTISGGQKARVTLARAVYANADIYLLDDPFSALDIEVANHIFRRCIRGILKSKIVVLVTHQIQFLDRADTVIYLEKGHVVAQGAPEDLIKDQTVTRLRSLSCSDQIPPALTEADLKTADETEDYFEGEAESAKTYKLTGAVDFQTYKEYFRAGSTMTSFVALIVFNIGTQCSQSGSDYWLKFWTRQIELGENSSSAVFDLETENETMYMIRTDLSTQAQIYCALIALLFMFSFLRGLTFFRICLNASGHLHNQMFHGLIRAPMLFFDTHPCGRILNRFSKDVDLMDDSLPPMFFSSIQSLLRCFGTIVIISVVTPIVLVPAAFLGVILVSVRRLYIQTIRSLTRLLSSARSPLFSHLSSSFYGIKTIRAFRNEEMLINQFYAHQDMHSAVYYTYSAATQWVGIWTDFVSVLFIGSVILTLVLSPHNVGDSAAGLAVSSAMTLTGMFQWGIRQSASVETIMISIERIIAYINLPSEADLNSDSVNKPSADWPQEGGISFSDVCLEYGPDAKALQNITMKIEPEEKVAIIGRTGAGKSSLVTALFRLAEPTGKIEIDGVNISKIGLHDLRSQISIIPQQPVLFQGTLRKNLDPFDKFTDDELWKVVHDVNLFEYFESFLSGLDMEIHEHGSNLSVGQRQLVCLARAILVKNKILVLDEATANVDLETDALVQRKVREIFKHCTVITVAHRLSTVIDCDRIAVMDQGRIIEFDTPARLLRNSESALSQIVAQTGENTASTLRILAKH